MTDSDSNLPKEYKDGASIPSADPEDIKRLYNVKPPWRSGNDIESACSPGADRSAVYSRWSMVTTLVDINLLTPWQHGEELDDAVFKLAATFPLQYLRHNDYQTTGDLLYPFDPNAFVQRLIDETGIAHTWKPVSTRLKEGERRYCFVLSEGEGPGTTATRETRRLLWGIWKRFANFDEPLAHDDKLAAFRVATQVFDRFVTDNSDLVLELEEGCRTGHNFSFETLKKLEEKARHNSYKFVAPSSTQSSSSGLRGPRWEELT
jgi:hypothetical protein